MARTSGRSDDSPCSPPLHAGVIAIIDTATRTVRRHRELMPADDTAVAATRRVERARPRIYSETVIEPPIGFEPARVGSSAEHCDVSCERLGLSIVDCADSDHHLLVQVGFIHRSRATP